MYYFEEDASTLGMRRCLDGQPVGPHHLALTWRTAEVRARSHRGAYHLTISDRWAYSYFYEDGTQNCVCMHYAEGRDRVREVEHMCERHAARQPRYPFLAGWPAMASEELAHAHA